MTTPEIQPPVQEAARHRISHASVAREDVARIIAPGAFSDDKDSGWTSSTRERAFAKADAILALLPASPAQAVEIDPSFLDTAALIIAKQINPAPWWWKSRFDDDHESTATRLRNENRAAANAIQRTAGLRRACPCSRNGSRSD